MDITKIWVSQLILRRFKQIPSMIESLKDGKFLPQITLIRCEDGEIQVEDGHHRLMSVWLSGKTDLESHQYVLIEKDQWKPRRGKIENLLEKNHDDWHGSQRF